MRNILAENHGVVIMGDINIDLLKHTNQDLNTYNEIISGNGYSILNKITPQITKDHQLVRYLTDLLRFDYPLSLIKNNLGDHNFMILDILKIATNNTQTNYKRFKIVDEDRVARGTNEADFNDCNDLFTSIIESPNKEMIIQNKKMMLKPYVSREILSKIREKIRIYLLAIFFPESSLLKQEYIWLLTRLIGKKGIIF